MGVVRGEGNRMRLSAFFMPLAATRQSKSIDERRIVNAIVSAVNMKPGGNRVFQICTRCVLFVHYSVVFLRFNACTTRLLEPDTDNVFLLNVSFKRTRWGAAHNVRE